MLGISFVVLLASTCCRRGAARHSGVDTVWRGVPPCGDAHPTRTQHWLHSVCAGSSSRCRWRSWRRYCSRHSRPCSPWRSPRGCRLLDTSRPGYRRRVRLTSHGARVVPINTVFDSPRMGNRQVRVPRQEHPHHAHRPAAGDSPVISGMIFVLLFGLHGWFGVWLREHDLSIISLRASCSPHVRDVSPTWRASDPAHAAAG